MATIKLSSGGTVTSTGIVDTFLWSGGSGVLAVQGDLDVGELLITARLDRDSTATFGQVTDDSGNPAKLSGVTTDGTVKTLYFSLPQCLIQLFMSGGTGLDFEYELSQNPGDHVK